MAKKVVIGDLVVKVGVDSKDTAKQLRALHNKLGKTHKREYTAAEKQAKLKKKILKEELKAHKLNDQYDAKKLKRLLEAHRMNKQYDDKRSRAKVREQAAEIRHQKAMQRLSRDVSRQRGRLIGTAGNFAGHLATGAGMGILGAGGLAAAATAGAVRSTGNFRVGEQLLTAGLESRGQSQGEVKETRDRLYRQSQYYNLDPAEMFKNIGAGLENLPGFQTKTVEQMVMGMGILGKSLGIANVDVARSLKGLQQFTVAQTAENLNQMTEAMPILVGQVSKALGVSKEDLLKAKAEGKLAELIQQGGGMTKFTEKLNAMVIGKGTELHEKNVGKLPNVLASLNTAFSHSVRLFGTEAEPGVVKFLNTLTKILWNNEATFVAAGQWIAVAFSTISDALSDAMVWLQPLIDEWVEAWSQMTDEEKKQSVLEFFGFLKKVFAILAGMILLSKAASVLHGIIKFTTDMGALLDGMAKLTGVSAATTQVGKLMTFISRIGSLLGMMVYSGNVGEGSDKVPEGKGYFQSSAADKASFHRFRDATALAGGPDVGRLTSEAADKSLTAGLVQGAKIEVYIDETGAPRVRPMDADESPNFLDIIGG